MTDWASGGPPALRLLNKHQIQKLMDFMFDWPWATSGEPAILLTFLLSDLYTRELMDFELKQRALKRKCCFCLKATGTAFIYCNGLTDKFYTVASGNDEFILGFCHEHDIINTDFSSIFNVRPATAEEIDVFLVLNE